MKQTLNGTVISNAAKDTAVVEVTVWKIHRIFKKRYKRTKKYQAHNPGNTFGVGTKVEMVSSRPISKTKHWIVTKEIVVGGKNTK